MMRISAITITLAYATVVCLAAQAQPVGNGSAIQPSDSERESYGINAPQPGSNPGSEFLTRHYRRGNESGIGGSFIQTTSPTSESSPAVKAPTAPQPGGAQFSLPKLQSTFTQSGISPALDVFTPAVPRAPESSALTSPVTTAPSLNQRQPSTGVEALPSFNKQKSLFEKMQFGTSP